jgi:radical SAM superfamily enzyme YgiQ (UPF0313 family)
MLFSNILDFTAYFGANLIKKRLIIVAMKVVIIAPPIMDYSWIGWKKDKLIPIGMDETRECPPYGVYLLTSILRQAGHEVVLADLIAQHSNSLSRYTSDIYDCSLVGIGATSMSWPTALDLILQIRDMRPDVPIVVGGIHATMFDQYLLRVFPIDYVIRGEGELALQGLCNSIENQTPIEEVPNLTWRNQDGQIVRNALGSKIPPEDLGLFPIPDYSDLPEGIYKGLAIESSRGCAFDCSFCSTAYRRAWRGIPPEIFVDRLEKIMQHLQRTQLGIIHVVDDEFSMNPKRAIDIIEIIRQRGLKPKLVYDSRATDLLVKGYVDNIAEYTAQFLVGAECGYDEGLKMIGKGTTTEILEKAAQLLKEYGIADRADYSFILALPWESKVEVEKTIRFASHIFSRYGVRILLQWYFQIPGSRLWEEARLNDLVNETMYNEYGFFRNLYLFRSAVKLTPREIYDISKTAGNLKSIAELRYPGQDMIQYTHPEPMMFFPKELMSVDKTGLASLREVSYPRKPTLPLRHIGIDEKA